VIYLEVTDLKTVTKSKLYEAMFLVDSALAASDWDGINVAIKKILKKEKAKVLYMKKWDERKLAYDIRRVSRGTYILCYFKAPGSVIQQVERDVQLSEKIMRVLILRADHINEKDIEKQIPVVTPEQRPEQVTTETEKSAGTEETFPEQDTAAFSFNEDLEQPDQTEDTTDYETNIEKEQEQTQ
jgi:small subunit ribosomal protein S6